MPFGDFLKSIFHYEAKVDVFARYEVLREAISGTMSKFYKARDRESGEVVGLKVLDKAQTEALEQRLRGLKKPTEGEIALALDHPRLVKTFRHGITTKDEQFLVMEYLEGAGLNSLILAKSPELAPVRLTLIRQAAEAIAAVHEAGYIHRDICPRNFVVFQDFSELKLIDFGLSVPATEDFTKPGNRTGTPAYMSPEVARRRPTDQRLDLFSFGVSAYEMCTWRRPWESGNKDGKAALAHDSVEPIPILELRPELDPRLAQAIMKCLVTDPNQRPRSMRAFLTQISMVESEIATTS
jgi:serine/threonine-protein kinase